MTPYDPQTPVPSPEPPAPVAEPAAPVAEPPIPNPQSPFWGYLDLLFFLSLVLPSLLAAALVVRGIAAVYPMGKPFQGLLGQFLAYVLIFGSLFFLLRLRYQQPFWRSLGWKFPVRGAAASFFAGPLLAIALGLVGSVLQTPEIELPFQQMLQDRATVIFFAAFVVILGPLAEELAFRGFLMPLLVRSLGAGAGIVTTGLLFGCLHAPEYGFHWQHVLLISTAGMVFGWVRFKTGSTAAAVFMHSTYNLTQFAAFLAQNRTV